jgi:alcohol dehydrogenase
MLAVAYKEHGDVFELKVDTKFPKPVPLDNQVLVKVYATSVNPVDYKFRRNAMMPNFLIPKPKIPGGDLAGVVVETGANVTKFHKGDRVAAFLPLMGSQWGSSAEFVAVRESHLCHIPESLSFLKAAALPLVALTVVQAFDHLKGPTKGKKVLIQAGAGGVGTFAIQYAKNVLEMEVTTTASEMKTHLVRTLGADHVIDYRKNDFSTIVQDFDVVLDPMSWKYESLTLNRGKNVLKRDGHYLNILSSDLVNGKEQSLGMTTVINAVKHTLFNKLSPGSIPRYNLIGVKPDGDRLQKVFALVEQGKILSVIDPQIFDIYEMTDAHAYLERHYATGKVVVRVSDDN